jgi:hypothetical protein
VAAGMGASRATLAFDAAHVRPRFAQATSWKRRQSWTRKRVNDSSAIRQAPTVSW